ncbi:MAG: hypothetical protein JKY43_07675 [Phycisphaerales bacterium]|nr:hypothetical protein [Phycisphaerales bacterium]
MPIHDWQFWVVTAAGVFAALWLIRLVLPKKKRGTRASLTVGGKPVGKRVKKPRDDCGCG